MTDRRFRAALLASALIAAPVLAQTQTATSATAFAESDEIIVTATKRNSTIQDIPFSINAQTGADLQRTGAQTIEDISRNVAGLTVQNLGPGQSQVSVRGVSAGQIVRDQPGVKEQVGVYLDESVTSLSLFTPDFDLFDLNRVETLRGPQGTLFGSGSVGGTIRYITNQPNTRKIEGEVEGNVNTLDGGGTGGWLKGAINLPIGEQVAARAVGYWTKFGGFIDAVGPAGGKDVNDGERYGGRLALAFRPTETITITPRIVYQKVTANGFNREERFNLYGNAFTTPVVQPQDRQQYLLLRERFEDETILGDLVASIDFGGVSATSVSSYIDRSILVSRDASALTGSVSIDLGFPTAGVLLPSRLNDATKLKQFTQEIRLASTGSGPFQWVIGGYFADIKRRYAQRLPTPGYDVFTDARFGAGTSVAVANGFPLNSPYNADINYNFKQYAAFGEATYAVTDRFKLTAGGRYYDFKEERTFKSGGLFSNSDSFTDPTQPANRTKSNGFTPRFLASYEVVDNVTFNAQASKGFRLGGVNDPLNLPLCMASDAAIFGGYQKYTDEKLWNYEGGIKARTGWLTINAAGFYNDIKNLQVTLDAGSCSSRVVFNVPKAHSAGFEFELSARPTPMFGVSVNGSIIDSKFDSTVRDGTGAVLGGIRDGNRLPTVPRFQIAVNADATLPLSTDADLKFTASYQYVGNRYTQPSDQENNPRSFVSGLAFAGASGTQATVLNLNLPSYHLVNFSAGVTIKSLDADLVAYVQNALDEDVQLSFDRERGGRARLGFNVGQPRTYGLTARKRF